MKRKRKTSMAFIKNIITIFFNNYKNNIYT